MIRNKRLIISLIIIDFIWAISALIYDFDKIISIPLQFWPFVIICPIYPFLLAIFWLLMLRNNKNDLLSAFAIIPSVVYFLATLIYYPTWMILNGFDILAFGQIFWVAVYGFQGIYLLRNYKINNFSILIATLFLLLSFLIQYLTNSFGFFDTTNFSPVLIGLGYLVLSIFAISILIGQTKKA